MVPKNPNSILLLYEGDTEEEFYTRIIDLKLPSRKIRITYDNLKGITSNINKKVLHKTIKHLDNHSDEDLINIFIAIDREGNRNCESPLDIDYIKKTISKDYDRIKNITEIIATQDIESWFFIDMDGIFEYLRIPMILRNQSKFKNYEAFNNRDLSNLFRRNKRSYFKGSRVGGFLDSLNLNKIYDNCPDLQAGINQMLDLI